MSDTPREQQEATRARMVEFWRSYDAMEARLSRPLTERMLDLAGVSPRMHVLDVACGRGEPAVPAAHRVGPEGLVLGIDLVDGVLQIARERARREGLENITLQVADAEALEVGARTFDVATVRWGLMYMREPERALASLHRALKPGGALVIASWAEPARVPWASLARRILERYREVPPLPSADEPGVFRHADPARLGAALERNGFSVEASEELEVPIVEARDASEIVTWIRQLGGPVMKLVGELPEPRQRAWEAELLVELERSREGERVTLGGVTKLTLGTALAVPGVGSPRE
ncbi:class I SAM-dependent methyltransferase [Corallococcus llansteffanensis]|uniref:Methyltransferase domain-containing protein n=1 Tax=Corallococcus llansteffanensis TaxID=2316731 RepID=A0A3A8QEL3_9BACT|nr:methyltransferase domain-containing protein [Corallococcus llansteffanensis]RKH64675.1 methyltransferase domain-containing protein [Corallococcus llansteffanensis]